MKKEDVLSFAKIILVSHWEKDYVALCEFGFKHILYFRNVDEAALYFEKNPEILGKYDVFFERYIRGGYNSKLQNLLWENKENILRVEFYYYSNNAKDTIRLQKQNVCGMDVYVGKRNWIKYDCIVGAEQYRNITISFTIACMLEHLRKKGLKENFNGEKSFTRSKQRKRTLKKQNFYLKK